MVFLSKSSNTTNLIDCLNEYTDFVVKENPTDVFLYIDLTNAYDAVSQVKSI